MDSSVPRPGGDGDVEEWYEAECGPVVPDEDDPAWHTTVCSPCKPSAEEVARHNITHWPHRSWCTVCIQARGRENAHRRNKRDDVDAAGNPVIALDYKSVGVRGFKLIVMRDQVSKSVSAHVVNSKGCADTWIIMRLMMDIDDLGYSRITLKCDGEPALVQLMEEIKRRRRHSTFLMHPPAYDPQANGLVEQIVQAVMN